MNFISLFAGIGGLDLGFERAGLTCKGQVEIDHYARAVLAKNWPDVWKWNDVRTLTGEMILEHCGRIDVVAGGFPCQDVSTAGTMRGVEAGTRSGLYAEVVRLICEVRPRFAVMENVSGLFVDGRIGTVLGDLAENGFDAEWDCLPASVFGARHVRTRVFILAYPQGGGCSGLQLSSTGEMEGLRGEAAGQGEPAGMFVADGASILASAAARSEFGRFSSHIRSIWETEPGVVRMADGVPDWSHRLKGCGNAIVPQAAEWIGRRVMQAAGGAA